MQASPPVVGGVYVPGVPASLLRAGEQQYVLQGQLNPANRASIALQLERIKSPHFYPFAMSVEVWFTSDPAGLTLAAPGTFEVDVQTADVDLDTHYVALSTTMTAVNASNVGRLELVSIYCKFARVFVKTLTNPVYVWALVTR